MYRLNSHLNNRTEYRFCDSPWAANLIAINIIRNCPEVNKVEIENRQTGKIERTYTR